MSNRSCRTIADHWLNENKKKCVKENQYQKPKKRKDRKGRGERQTGKLALRIALLGREDSDIGVGQTEVDFGRIGSWAFDDGVGDGASHQQLILAAAGAAAAVTVITINDIVIATIATTVVVVGQEPNRSSLCCHKRRPP